MMVSLLWCVLGVVVLTTSACEGRHIHENPRHHGNPESVWDEMTELAKQHAAEHVEKKALDDTDTSPDEIAPIDIIKSLKPVWFVPINSPFYFGSIIEPCQEGYKRDRFGICREVW